MLISFAMGSRCKRSFQCNMGLTVIPSTIILVKNMAVKKHLLSIDSAMTLFRACIQPFLRMIFITSYCPRENSKTTTIYAIPIFENCLQGMWNSQKRLKARPIPREIQD